MYAEGRTEGDGSVHLLFLRSFLGWVIGFTRKTLIIFPMHDTRSAPGPQTSPKSTPVPPESSPVCL